MQENPIPWWGNSFLLFFILAWLVRTILLPFLTSKRGNRPFRYALILPEERATFTSREKRLLIVMNVLTYAGILSFIATAAYLFNYAYHYRGTR